jgi:hypothetical protein
MRSLDEIRLSHSIAISGDAWPEDARLSDIEHRFLCEASASAAPRRAAGFQLGQEARACHGLSLMSWSRAFHVPIPLPDGRMLRTLRDAGEYIQELPRATHQRPEWKIAAEMLLEAVEGKGPLMFAEIAIRKAVNAGKPAPEPTPRRRGRR